MRNILLVLGMAAVAAAPLDAQRIRTGIPLKQLEEMAAQDSHDAASHYNVALGYWSEKKFDQAEASLKRAVELEPRFSVAYLALAMLPFARREQLWNESLEGRVPAEWRDALAESDRLYRTTFMMDPLTELRIMGAVEPKKSVLWDVDPMLSRLYSEWLRGFDDFRDGDYGGAYLRLERLARELSAGRREAKHLPSSLLWYRGLAAAHTEKYDESVRDLRALLDQVVREQDPEKLTYLPLRVNDYRFALGSVLARAGKYNEAVPVLEAVVAEDAGMYMAHVLLGHIYETRGAMTAAAEQRAAAIAANPEDATSSIEAAVTFAQLGRNAEAEQALRAALDVQPESFRAWRLMGILQAALGRPEEARTSFNRYLELAPSRLGTEIADVRRRLATVGG
ncbi:MAG TPA: tetratricopeptide repeat protein [Longimicrobiales bacterium]|nr:tetratricopeptide repeat protein [Longimicrobiales bacterium]